MNGHTMKKVLYISNTPSQYRVKYFNRLSNYVDLTVIYERSYLPNNDAKIVSYSDICYRAIFLNDKKHTINLNKLLNIKKILKNEKYDYIVFCNYSTLVGIIGIHYCKQHKLRYSIEEDGASFKKSVLKNIINRKVVNKAQYCFSTCNNLDEYYLKLGANPKRIERYKISSMTFDEMYHKNYLTNASFINDTFTILFVGQFLKRKGIDILLKSLKQIKHPVKLICVGGEPTTEYKKIIKQYNLTNVSFHPFCYGETLAYFYRHANLFVLPTREDKWGLVVNEALSFGVPVVTTDRCNAGIVLIKDQYNGIIVKHNDVNSLAKGINKMIETLDKNDLLDNCAKSVFEYTIDNMVSDHLAIFDN